MRNWDYRYAWPRDASIGIGAFLGVGKADEARGFLALAAARQPARPAPPAGAAHPRRPTRTPGARRCAGWPGYAGSVPVRVGNGAADQHQLDGYGWVLDAAWVLVQAGHHLYSETWRAMRGFADLVARRWREPDAGIWEIRDDAAHHVHSKLMGWLALDRALRIADTHRTPRPAASALADRARRHRRRGPGTRLRPGQGQLHPQLRLRRPRRGAARPAAAGHRGRRLARACAARSTPSERSCRAGGPLLYRYPPGRDGLPGTEGAFLPCSFWLVQALARTGQTRRGRRAVPGAARAGQPARPLRRGDGPRRPAPTSATSRRR